MKSFYFHIVLVGTGKDSDEAWEDAVDGFNQDAEQIPYDCNIELIEDNEETG